MIRSILGLVVLTLAVLPATAQTVFVNDDFTVAATTLLENHAPDLGGAWQRGGGKKGINLIAPGNHAVNIGSNDWVVYMNTAEAPSDEYVVFATVTFSKSSSKSFVEIYGRVDTTLNNGYLARLSADGTVALILYNGGKATTLATSKVVISLTKEIHLTLTIDDNFKRVSIEGTTEVNSNDNTITKGGLVALGMQSYAAGDVIVDRFAANYIAP